MFQILVYWLAIGAPNQMAIMTNTNNAPNAKASCGPDHCATNIRSLVVGRDGFGDPAGRGSTGRGAGLGVWGEGCCAAGCPVRAHRISVTLCQRCCRSSSIARVTTVSIVGDIDGFSWRRRGRLYGVDVGSYPVRA